MLRNLSALPSIHINAFLKSFNTIFCDYDGVISDHITQKPIKNVIESLEMLKVLNKNVYILTNNTTYNKSTLRKNNLIADDIITPTDAMMHYLKKNRFNKEIYVIGSQNMRNQLRNNGFKLSKQEPGIIEEDFKIYVRNLEDNPNVGCVIIDWDFNVTHVKLLRASVYLTRPNVLYLTGCGTQKLTKLDKTVFGVGFFQSAISNFCKRQPLIFGKPSLPMKSYIYDKYQLEDPQNVLLVGDSFKEDMHFANMCGFQKLLILSGLSGLDDIDKLKELNSNLQTNYYLNSFGDFRKLLNNDCVLT